MTTSLFIAIEGLDGSGKTTLAKQLAKFLEQTLDQPVQFTFQPYDDCCGGEYIRQVLRKEITRFTPEALLYGYAANRQDHCSRVINPFLDEQNGVIICDRYYLSSLVYQSDEDHPFSFVMKINEVARQPDLTIFMNVTDETIQARMQARNLPPELFEKDYATTRQKYQDAITFLQETRGDQIVEIDAGGTMEEVLELLVREVVQIRPEWRQQLLSALPKFKISA